MRHIPNVWQTKLPDCAGGESNLRSRKPSNEDRNGSGCRGHVVLIIARTGPCSTAAPLSGRGPSQSRATTKGNERCEAVQRRRPHPLYPPEPSQRAKRSEGVAVGDDSKRERGPDARKSFDLGGGSDVEIDGRAWKRLPVARRLCHRSRGRRTTRIRVDPGTWTWKPRSNAPGPIRRAIERAIWPGE